MSTPPTPPIKYFPRGPVAMLGGVVRGVKHWAPVWIPSLLLWQFTTRGLQPALGEAGRLREIAPEVHARHAEAKEAFEQVQAEAQAWQDPVYRERRRRMRFQEPIADELAQPMLEDPLTENLAEAAVSGFGPAEAKLELPAQPEWAEHVTSPSDFLEGYDPEEELTTDPIVAGQSSWQGEVSSQIPAASEATVPTPVPMWTAAEPGWSAAPAFETTQPAAPAPAASQADSPFQVD